MGPVAGSILGGVASGITQGLGNIFGSGISYGRQKKLLRMQNEFNTQAATTAFERQMEMWNLENSYNTPSAQMSRYKDAGLNPNLIYGNSNTSSGFSSAPQARSSGASSAPGFSLPNLLSQISSLYDLKLKRKQSDLVDAEIADKSASAALKGQSATESASRIARNAAWISRSSFDLDLAKSLRDWTIKNAISKNAQINASTKALLNQAGLTDVNRQYRELEFHDYKHRGIRPTDPLWYRTLPKVMSEFESRQANGMSGSLLDAVIDVLLNNNNPNN